MDEHDVRRIQNAIVLAQHSHRDQRRKYTGEPYFVHLAEVASLVALVTQDSRVIATAYLHDTLEDTTATCADLALDCGVDVMEWVVWLTDSPASVGNRKKRKAIDNERLANAPPQVQTIKCADSISNTRSIKEHDPNFWVVYSREKMELLSRLDKADPVLRTIALGMASLS